MSVRLELSQAQKEQLKEKMNQLVIRNRKAMEQAFSAAGLDMQNKAREIAPVDTGRLRQSIRAEQINDGLGTRISTNVEYAAAQNFGNGRRAGKHFMEAGYEAGVSRLLRTLKIK